MGNRDWRKLVFVLLCPALFLFAASVQAASPGKIEVASRLGEPFYAEVPLKLESNELASKVFVEIADPSDYKIFEVYRDPILKTIRADVASDKRGVRVELSSRSRIKSPFFNLVLKIRYGRVSHFKKFPIFLDMAKSIQQAASKAPQPTVDAIKQPMAAAPRTSLTKSAGQVFMPEPAISAATNLEPESTYYEGWARTGRYGPIVRGDTLTTVAERLRIDYRYSRNQIMMALFEKNSSSFDQNNINLLKAGSRLNVPTAAEVEKHHKSEASRFLTEQEKKWKELTRQPRYAAEKEAQRTRYTKRISVGEHADGVATAPVVVAELADKTALAAPIKPLTQPKPQTGASEQKSAAPAESTAAQTSEIAVAVTQAQAESSRMVDELRQQNVLLQKQLSNNQKSIETLNRKIEGDVVMAAAAKAHLDKLEILISRLQSELEAVERQKSVPVFAGMDWMIWILIALVLILIGVVAILMRREPAHPAVAMESPAPEAAAATVSEGRNETLELDTAHETGDIGTAKSDKETATIDSLPVFTDELSDTDTAELEPFDADADVEPDPDIDYMAEADVYIRYGMDDEAIKQLDMALRLQPDHVEAHIKKAELLLGKSDNSGLDDSIAAATVTLAAVDLERFKASIEQLETETDHHFSKLETQQPQPELDEPEQDALPLDESAADDLDFDLSELDVPDIEQDKPQGEQSQLGKPNEPVTADMADATSTIDMPDFDLTGGATQELDQLLSEFDEDENDAISFVDTQHGLEDSVFEQDKDATAAITSETIGTDTDHGTTQELDNLLAGFSDSDEDQIIIGDATGELDASFFKSAESASRSTVDTTGLDTDHGATQALDHLLDESKNEFQDNDKENDNKDDSRDDSRDDSHRDDKKN